MERRPVLLQLAIITAILALIWAVFQGPARLGYDLHMGWRIALLFALMLVLGVWFAVRTSKKWRRLSDTLNIPPDPDQMKEAGWLGMPDLAGTWKGTPVRLHNEAHGGHDRRRYYSQVTMKTSAEGPSLYVERRRLSGMASFIQGEEFETGDGEWDKEFRSYGSPDGARQWLTPEVKQAIQELDEVGVVAIETRELRHVLRHYRVKPDRVAARLDRLQRLRGALERAS